MSENDRSDIVFLLPFQHQHDFSEHTCAHTAHRKQRLSCRQQNCPAFKLERGIKRCGQITGTFIIGMVTRRDKHFEPARGLYMILLLISAT